MASATWYSIIFYSVSTYLVFLQNFPGKYLFADIYESAPSTGDYTVDEFFMLKI